MRVRYEGELGFGVTAKDLILATIGQLGVGGCRPRRRVRRQGDRPLSMEGRMTVCNMTIEGGGRAGMVAPDETTFAWFAAASARGAGGRRARRGDRAAGGSCAATTGAQLRQGGHDRGRAISPQVTWGTNPGMVRAVTEPRARPEDFDSRPTRRAERALATWASSPARRSRRSRSTGVHRLVHQLAHRRPAGRRRDRRRPQGRCQRRARWSCPAPSRSRRRPRRRGWTVFRDAGFDWREAGCSMCLGMNPDILAAGRALRLDLEPQLRGPPGTRRAHPPGLPADGRGGRYRGALRRHPVVDVSAARRSHLAARRAR